ncbi:MAG: nucleotidyltransferase domain-containing protein [Candidatus Latescibacterota bacterium]|nr:nucleotidyltransferase domain-containing protein [Candidatus Latescibacterota bacterium]
MDLDRSERNEIAKAIVAILQEEAPGSVTELHGSLAEGKADSYSDIDLLWEVRDEDFTALCYGLEETLSRVRAIASLRFDIKTQRSTKHRRAFVRFSGLPLFWWVDLEIFARSIRCERHFDEDNPLARGAEWSYTHSALMCAVAAIKAQLRGRGSTALELVSSGFQKIAVPVTGANAWERIEALVDAVYDADDAQALLAAEVKSLLLQASAVRR